MSGTNNQDKISDILEYLGSLNETELFDFNQKRITKFGAGLSESKNTVEEVVEKEDESNKKCSIYIVKADKSQIMALSIYLKTKLELDLASVKKIVDALNTGNKMLLKENVMLLNAKEIEKNCKENPKTSSAIFELIIS